MASILSQNFNSSGSRLWEVRRTHQLQLVLLWLSCSTTVSVLRQCSSICLFFTFFHFHSMVRQNSKIHKTASSLIFSFFYCYWNRSGLLAGIKISDNFMNLVLYEWFWVLQISFCGVVKFQSFAQFPVNHLSHPVITSFLLLFLSVFCICLLCD